MSKSVKIDVHHVTRVEGHGNLVVRAADGKVEKAEWIVPEAPRFFEAMVRGRKWNDIQTIVSRICGICSISHSLACIKGIESAMGITVTPQTEKLRLLTHYSEMLQSHVLHAGYLVAPDLLGVKSVVPLVTSHPEVVKKIINLHRLANDWSDLMAGRTTHPITLQPGGFSKIPTVKELDELRCRLEEAVPVFTDVLDTLLSLADKIPVFDRPTEYIALQNPGVYAFSGGSIASTDTTEKTPIDRFETVVNEYVTPQSTAKWTKWHRSSYAVGALARYNLNHTWLSPMAKAVASQFGLKPGISNPYLNTVVQLVECAHVVEDTLKMIGEIVRDGLKEEKHLVKPKAGCGVGCVEAPRGILFHRYHFNEDGVCSGANICIPTNQNHGNIQADLETLVPTLLELPVDDIRLRMEMLVRSYDPCISCSTHFMDVEFV